MPRLLKRLESENDLEETWWFIAQESPGNAYRFLDRIQENCLALSGFPKLGVSHEEFKTDLRSHPVGTYLIFYFPLYYERYAVREANKPPASISLKKNRLRIVKSVYAAI